MHTWNLTRENTRISLTAAGEWNRYKLHYNADVPLRGTITYTLDGAVISEDFFLEAGTNQSFTCFIDAYLDGQRASDVRFMDLATIVDEAAHFDLLDFSVEDAAVLASKTYYFENERYRIGVELCWGGGLSYLQDKRCPVSDLENLLNDFDAGRLIQQSYYGTNQPPYVCGQFNGQKWCYNPVQGGDRGQFKSKLVDVEIKPHEVYVKCRPRDWGHSGSITYAYMENRYRLDGDYCVVDNRFVDFSGWEHPCTSQELPAFYTVSYLGEYYYYDGDRPWADAPLSSRHDLPFWPSDWNYCTFPLREGNTESWSAFVDQDGYGLGLFTPGVTRTVAGRNAYNGTKDPHSAPCNYIAPLRNLRIRCFAPITYSYLLTAGTLPEIRQAFKSRKDDITNEALKNY